MSPLPSARSICSALPGTASPARRDGRVGPPESGPPALLLRGWGPFSTARRATSSGAIERPTGIALRGDSNLPGRGWRSILPRPRQSGAGERPAESRNDHRGFCRRMNARDAHFPIGLRSPLVLIAHYPPRDSLPSRGSIAHEWRRTSATNPSPRGGLTHWEALVSHAALTK